MIKKIRVQIAAVLLALILFFVGFVYGSAILDMRTSIDNDAESVLTMMQSAVFIRYDTGTPTLNINPMFEQLEDEELENDYKRRASFWALVVDNEGYQSLSFVQKGNLYTEEELKSIVNDVLSIEDSSGRNDGYYFSTKKQGNISVIAVIDKTFDIEALQRIAFTMLFISIVGFIIIAVVVWILTGFITRPIKDAMDAKKRFISDASHELKTPLTIISANAEVLKEDVGQENDWLNNIKAQTHRMQELVQELLDLSALEEVDFDNSSNGKKYKKEKFSLSGITEEAVLPFDAIAYERGLKLTYDFSQEIMATGDPDAFRKIVGTLVDNAIKYASENGEVNVTLKQSQSSAVLAVYNTGCGIKDEERNRVFERFYRSDQSRARETGGSGLGLAIAKATANRNNWSLKLDSEENKYTKFILTIKIA